MATFISLFNELDCIEVPVLQRDFAQGRQSAKEIRVRFISAIHDALTKHHDNNEYCLDLDFVYGSYAVGSQKKTFSVLDGQQRLTTLFLLHWYAGLKDDCLSNFQDLVRQNNRQSRFRYHTRQSSSEFFDALVTHHVDYALVKEANVSISEYIEDQNWFFLHWRYDPTIRSCLVVLDTIEQHFKDLPFPFYESISNQKSPAVTFQFLNLEDFSLSDDLYIKMNGRGKPLTAFENFKAWLVGISDDFQFDGTFGLKLDQRWTDLFWRLADGEPDKFDALYLAFFKIVALFDACRKWERYSAISDDEVSGWIASLRSGLADVPLREFEEQGSFGLETLTAAANFLDVCGTEVFSSFKDVFKTALSGREYVPLARLYARFVFIDRTNVGTLSDDQAVQFERWCRVCDNLIHNVRIDEFVSLISAVRGTDTLSEFCSDIYGALPEFDDFQQVLLFRNDQLEEEAEKASLILKDPNWEALLIETESHPYLMGHVGFILDLCRTEDDLPDRGKFSEKAVIIKQLLSREILNSSDFLLQRALLTIDDYLVHGRASRYSLCVPSSGNYRERSENWLQVVKKPVFAQLLNSIKDDVYTDLRKLIEESSATGWRQLFVRFPQVIRYCEMRWIHRDSGGIYLLSKTRFSGYHTELWSFVFSKWLDQLESHAPIIRAVPIEVYGDDMPSVRVELSNGKNVTVSYRRGAGFKCQNIVNDDGSLEEGAEIPPELAGYLDRFITEFPDD